MLQREKHGWVWLVLRSPLHVPGACWVWHLWCHCISSPPLPPPSFFPVILESTSHDCLYVSSTIFTALVPPPRNHAAPAHPLTAFTYVGVRRLPPNHKWKKQAVWEDVRRIGVVFANLETRKDIFRTWVYNLHQQLDESLVCESSDIMWAGMSEEFLID